MQQNCWSVKMSWLHIWVHFDKMVTRDCRIFTKVNGYCSEVRLSQFDSLKSYTVNCANLFQKSYGPWSVFKIRLSDVGLKPWLGAFLFPAVLTAPCCCSCLWYCRGHQASVLQWETGHVKWPLLTPIKQKGCSWQVGNVMKE